MTNSFAEDPSVWLEKYEAAAVKDQHQMLLEILPEQIPQEWLQEIDFADLLIQMNDELQSCNLNQESLALIELMKDKQPKLYKKEYIYFDRFVIQYALYTKDKELLNKGLELFKKYPGKDFDYLFIVLDSLIFYERIEEVVELCTIGYQKIAQDRDLDNGLADELGWMLITNSLEQIHHQQQQGTVSWQPLQNELQKYGYDAQNVWLEDVQASIEQEFNLDNFLGYFKRTKFQARAFNLLSTAFYSYLKTNYQMSFCCSQRVWANIFSFFDTHKLKAKQQTNPNTFFTFTKKELDAYLGQKLYGFFSLGRNEAMSVLWGLPYLYEFLLAQEVIREPVHRKAIAIIEDLKLELLASYTDSTDVWQYDFINRWQPDRQTGTDKQQIQRDLFQRSFERSESLSDVPGEGNLESYLTELADKLGVDFDNFRLQQETESEVPESDATEVEQEQPKPVSKKTKKKKKKSGFGMAAELYKK